MPSEGSLLRQLFLCYDGSLPWKSFHLKVW